MKKLVLIALGAAVSAASAREWTVDAQGGGDYTVIQDAIDAASAGDTIWVKPGVYATGGRATSEGSDNTARVLLTKPLTLAATSADPADTHIVGAPDPNSALDGKDYEGRGPNAVRCIRLEKVAASGGTVIRGFTIRDGYSAQRYNGDSYGANDSLLVAQPGGVTSFSAAYANFYVTDCVITNCYGVRGGLVRYGRYVRCRFADGHANAGAMLGKDIKALSSLFLKMPGACAANSTFVNCTFADGNGAALHLDSGSQNNTVCNTIVSAMGEAKFSAKAGNGTAKNSVFDRQPFSNATACHVGLAYPLFAPLRGDFRLRAGTVAATAGDAALIAPAFPNAPAAVDLYRSLDGTPFAATGAIPVGCYAQTAVAAGGAVQFDGANTVVCNGYAGTVGGFYAFSETSHAVFPVRPPTGKTYFGFSRATEQGGYQFPEMDESLYVAVPPTGVVVTNTAVAVAKEYWVDPVNGSDENAGTSSASPLKTLAKAASLLKQKEPTLVHCAAGDYAEGGAVASDANTTDTITNRLAISDYRICARFKGAGRGVSFISGAPDPDSDDGRGPKALRCVYLTGSSAEGPVAIQGFTLRNGFSGHGDTQDDQSYLGGLVRNGASTSLRQVIDCELVGGCAYRGAFAMNGTFTRCLFHGATDLGGGALRGATVRSSVFYGNGGKMLDFDNTVRQTTISSTNGVSVLGIDSATKKAATLVGSALQATGCTSDLKVTDFTGVCYSFDNGKKLTGGTEGESYLARDLGFVDFAHDDLRLRSDSSLVTAPVPVDADYWKAPATDVNGVPFSYKGGTTVAGGIFAPVPVLVVEKPAFGAATNVGTNVVEVGKTLTVDFTPSTKRRLEAILVNGEPVEGTSYTFAPGAALADDGAPIPSVTLSYLFSTNWYVNATSGSDDNDGFTSEMPWRTLAKIATSGLMLPGDCVHAAAGDYAEGTVVPSDDTTAGNCRVVLPTGVTLVADEGADVTRIVGAADATATATGTYGRGANAVRCAYLGDGARLVGFTLADGRVPSTGNGSSEGNLSGDVACMGGGVYATEMKAKFVADATGGVFDCVITNCVAGRGGAVFGTRLVNSKVVDCVGTACSPVGYNAAIYGTAVDHVTREKLTLFRNCYVVSHVTVGADVTPGNFFDNLKTPMQIDNSVILSKLTAFGNKLVYTNCLVNVAAETFEAFDAARRPGCTRIDSAEAAGLDAEGRPQGKTAATVDAATATAFPAATDADGLPRVSNGTMDIGAFEYDWRPDYAEDLGSLGDVVAADAAVVETEDSKVLIPSGELVLEIADDAQRGRYRFPVQVTGTGTLTISAGEQVLATFVAADGERVFRYKTRTAGNVLTFAYEPGADDDGGAVLAKATGGPGLVFVIR